jgi:hypothetical protein
VPDCLLDVSFNLVIHLNTIKNEKNTFMLPDVRKCNAHSTNHVVFSPKTFNLNLIMRKQSDMGSFVSIVAWTLQKCQCHELIEERKQNDYYSGLKELKRFNK